jgi:hypothetical protein
LDPKVGEMVVFGLNLRVIRIKTVVRHISSLALIESPQNNDLRVLLSLFFFVEVFSRVLLLSRLKLVVAVLPSKVNILVAFQRKRVQSSEHFFLSFRLLVIDLFIESLLKGPLSKSQLKFIKRLDFIELKFVF